MGPDTESAKTDTPPAAPQAPPTAPQAPPATPQGPSLAQTAGSATLRVTQQLLMWVGAQLMRPKVRSVVVGLILIIIGGEFIDHSLWTFPIVIVGILMIVVAWVGHRLEGRFGIEWSEDGAGFEMRARFKARPALPMPAAPFGSATHVEPTTTVTGSTSSTRPVTTSEVVTDAAEDANVIEGEAHTIEIDVEELKALIEAAEMATVTSATTNGTPVSWQAVSSGIDRGVDGAGG